MKITIIHNFDMGLFSKKIPPVHQTFIKELPKMPVFEVPEMVTPTLAKYQQLTQKEYTPITALANALMGTDMEKFFGDSLTIKAKDRPELTEAKKELRQKYFDTLQNMYSVANTFVDRLQSVDGIFSVFMKQMNKINNQVANQVFSSLPTGEKPSEDSAILNNMFSQIQDIKNFMDERITRQYEMQKQELEASLGEENQNSSYGLWKKAYLENAYANRLMESDYELITKQSGVILDNALKQMELVSKPLLMQMGAMQQALSADLEGQKFEEEQFQNDRNYDLQRQMAEHQLELQRKGEVVKGKQAQESLNLEQQKLRSEQITQQNLAQLQREANINQRSLEEGKFALQGEIEKIKNKQFYDNMTFAAKKQDVENLFAKTQLNNEAEYRRWQTKNARKTSAVGKALSGIIQIGGGLLLANKLPAAYNAVKGFLGFGG